MKNNFYKKTLNIHAHIFWYEEYKSKKPKEKIDNIKRSIISYSKFLQKLLKKEYYLFKPMQKISIVFKHFKNVIFEENKITFLSSSKKEGKKYKVVFSISEKSNDDYQNYMSI